MPDHVRAGLECIRCGGTGVNVGTPDLANCATCDGRGERPELYDTEAYYERPADA